MDFRVPRVEDYQPLVGSENVERILAKARRFCGFRVTHINSTYYGGGVAELLSTLTLLLNGMGIQAGWRVLQGVPDFFGITKNMHNALQGKPFEFTPLKQRIYEEIVFQNSIRNHLNHDMVIVHDPQPLALIAHYEKRSPWIWRCHIDLSNPHRGLWQYLSQFIERYDAAIFSIKEYAQQLKIPQIFVLPAIDPFSSKNRELSEETMKERLAHYDIPTDLPLVVQVSRFDPWKDPKGVIEAFKMARTETPATLVLLGNFASDDPEGARIYEDLLKCREERIFILPNGDDTALVNTLQRKAAVVLQKSLREGFGLTVAEAMWKGTPVIGGNVGGIRYQIQDGINGFLVSSPQEAGQRIVQLLKEPQKRKDMGRLAKESVREKFLMTRYLERYLDLFGAFEARFHYKGAATA